MEEQPALLSPYMEDIIVPLTDTLIRILQHSLSDSSSSFQRMDSSQFDAVCKVVQLFCRVRGYKHVIKFFPHEVSHIEMCMRALKAQDKTDHMNWETRYVMLLWLCILCLIPFDICSMDSSVCCVGSAPDDSNARTHSRLVVDIISVCKEHLSESGPTREASFACLSALLTRPDMDTTILAEFMEWSCARLNAWAAKGEAAEQELNRDSFQLIGLLHCLSQIFKKGHRSNVLPFAAMALEPCLQLGNQPNQTLVRKLLTKVYQRIGLAFLPPREASWRYQRGSRSLVRNLAATQQGMETSKDNDSPEKQEEDTADDDDDVDVPAEMEDIVERLLCALRDKDTVVRWSAAKGIGRVTMRLPQGFGDDVVGAVCDVFGEDEDSAWHGGCLALAELSRRGLLLPSRLESVVPTVVKAMHFDIVHGQHSVGAHVRDAASYVCWAFARAYAPQVMRPFVSAFTEAMLLAALFDREINCRRAASAAFQENVGRQGNENFPHGIEVIGVADYFSLGSRTSAYLSIAPAVARMSDTFLRFITKHLSEVKLSHWDSDVRSLAARSLGKLAVLDRALATDNIRTVVANCMSTVPAHRHGSLLATAEVVLALSLEKGTGEYEGGLPVDLVDEVSQLIPRLEKGRMYRGKGGEQMRVAACFLIETIGRAQLQMPIKTQVALVEALNENLRQPHESIQTAACSALRQVLFSYFPVSDESGPSDRLQKLTVMRYMNGLSSEENIAAARGYALALGTLPPKLVKLPEGRTLEVLSCLAKAADPCCKIAGESDTETRRNAINSIVELTEKIIPLGLLALEDHVKKADTNQRVQSAGDVLSVLLTACDDYNVDKRGDTGSWCRIAALRGMMRLVLVMSRQGSTVPHAPTSKYSYLVRDSGASSEEGLIKVRQGAHVLTAFGHGLVEDVCADSNCDSGILKVSYPPHSFGAVTAPIEGDRLLCKLRGVELLGYSSHDTACTNGVAGFIVPSAVERRQLISCPTRSVGTIESEASLLSFEDKESWSLLPVSPVSEGKMKLVMCAILKQLGEKLDSVREVAGGVLEHLVRSSDPVIMSIPDKCIVLGCISQIEKRLSTSSDASELRERNKDMSSNDLFVKWSRPKYVYTFLTGILDSSLYFESIISGMIISIGGLSEGIVKESSAALLHWCNVQKASKNLRDLSLLADALVSIFRSNARDSRVVMPLLKCLSSLLRNGVFDFMLSSTLHSFGVDIMRLLGAELKGCGEVLKLRAGTDMYLLMMQFDDPVRPAALKALLMLTGHKYPKVRKYAAEQLYLQMVSDPYAVGPSKEAVQAVLKTDAEVAALASQGSATSPILSEARRCSGIAPSQEILDEAMELITTTVWEKSTEHAREIRTRLCVILEVDLKIVSKAPKLSDDTARAQATDELDSYDSLVREVGY